jgi:hypothetical protein
VKWIRCRILSRGHPPLIRDGHADEPLLCPIDSSYPIARFPPSTPANPATPTYLPPVPPRGRLRLHSTVTFDSSSIPAYSRKSPQSFPDEMVDFADRVTFLSFVLKGTRLHVTLSPVSRSTACPLPTQFVDPHSSPRGDKPVFSCAIISLSLKTPNHPRTWPALPPTSSLASGMRVWRTTPLASWALALWDSLSARSRTHRSDGGVPAWFASGDRRGTAGNKVHWVAGAGRRGFEANAVISEYEDDAVHRLCDRHG